MINKQFCGKISKIKKAASKVIFNAWRAFHMLLLAAAAAVGFSATINVKAVCQTPQFASPVTIGVNRPVAIAPGDFNGDGNVDLAILRNLQTGSFPGVVEVFLNNGSGNFASTGIQYNAISNAGGQLFVNDLAAADFNNDGKLDLVAAGNFASSGVLLGNGNGGFGAPLSLTLPDTPGFVAVGDFNNDNKTDIVSKTFGTNVQVSPGLGNGTFGTAVVITTGQGGSSVVVRDFNNDGFLDFAAANSSSTAQTVSIRLGNGNFGFSSPPNIEIARVLELTADDFNNDGKQDFVGITYNFSPNRASVHLGSGDGTFNSPVGNPFPVINQQLQFIKSADFNGDNRPDIAVTNIGINDSLSIMLNNGAGVFGAATNFTPDQGLSARLYPVDFDRNGATDLVVVKEFSLNKVVLMRNTCAPAAAKSDFDGDGKTDISIFRPAPSEWWYSRSTDGQVLAAQFGASGDIITPGDFTGDGKTDIAVFRPSNGFWFILRSENGSFFSFPFGTAGDIPAPSDYDGDGKTDVAVFRPSSATWFILRSTDGGATITNFGASGDKPVIADYDGDRQADIAIFRPSSGEWWISKSSNGQTTALQFGISSDKPVAGDYTGDRKADIAFFRPSTGNWFILRSEDNSFFSFPFGANGDIPAPGDYDGDGKTDAAVFRPVNATWFINRSTAGVLIATFGAANDLPVPSAFVP